jgi:uncharacterized membrane protein
MKKILFILFFISITILSGTETILAQEIHQDLQGVWKARVTNVISEEKKIIAGTETTATVQQIEAEIKEGEKKGEIITFENDYIRLETGDSFYLNYLITINGHEIYSVREIDRRMSLLFFTLLFVGVIIAFGGKQGILSLVSLAMTFLAIIFILLPLLLKGYSPALVSSVVATIVLGVVIFLTHGLNRESISAFIGTVSAVIISSVLAIIAISATRLTGFASDESVYLNMYTYGKLNFNGILLGGIIIGALGVLDDISITQASMVRELYSANKNLTDTQVFKKALRVGREHVGALVNTLALAYAGASLPLLLLMSMSEMPFLTLLNQEMFATEIIRTIIGSIGLVMAVPITTYIAVKLLKNAPPSDSHHHSHGHIH